MFVKNVFELEDVADAKVVKLILENKSEGKQKVI